MEEDEGTFYVDSIILQGYIKAEASLSFSLHVNVRRILFFFFLYYFLDIKPTLWIQKHSSHNMDKT